MVWRADSEAAKVAVDLRRSKLRIAARNRLQKLGVSPQNGQRTGFIHHAPSQHLFWRSGNRAIKPVSVKRLPAYELGIIRFYLMRLAEYRYSNFPGSTRVWLPTPASVTETAARRFGYTCQERPVFSRHPGRRLCFETPAVLQAYKFM